MSPTQVRIRKTCKKCRGSGSIYNPLWQVREQAMVYEDNFDEQSFWAEHGFPNGAPPEVLPCPDCNGEGWQYSYVDIQTFQGLLHDRD